MATNDLDQAQLESKSQFPTREDRGQAPNNDKTALK